LSDEEKGRKGNSPDENSGVLSEIEGELRAIFSRVRRNPDDNPGPEGGGDIPGVLDDFRILREIGKGGMGTVYEAEQISLNRRVALKILPPHLSLSDDAILKFRREAEAGGRQSHQAIVAVHAVGEQKGIHYIAQELVEGGSTLTDRMEEIRAEGDLPRGYFREAAQLAAEVADALQHAHDAGVIHRDVKPSNILITPDGDPKVTDFGLAKVEDALALSRTGDFAGTPYYMSPEQAASNRIGIDRRTDIFSLGATFYEMLTLTRPFQGKSSQEVLRKILLNEPPDPRRINECVPRDLAVICLRAMEKDPSRRYQTMKGFADDLRRFLSGDVILARPAGFATRFMKRLRRNPAFSAAAAVAFIAVAALLGAIPWHIMQITTERDAANQQRVIAEGERENSRASETSAIAARNAAVADRDAKERALVEKEEALAAKAATLVQSEGLRLAASSSLLLDEDPGLALLLALESAARTPGIFANTALIDALRECREERTFDCGGAVSEIALSPDGKRLVVATMERTWIADAATGKTFGFLGRGRNSDRAVSFSSDGGKVITASFNSDVVFWDAWSGKELSRFIDPERKRFIEARLAPDGESLLTLRSLGRAQIWDFERKTEIASLAGVDFSQGTVRFSLDGSRVVVSGFRDGTVLINSVATGGIVAKLEGHEEKTHFAAFDRRGSRVVTASADNTARIWDADDGKCLAILSGHGDSVNSARFSPDGNLVVTASSDGTARIWNAATGDELTSLRGHRQQVNSALFGPGGRKVYTASNDGTVRVWRAAARGAIITLGEHAIPGAPTGFLPADIPDIFRTLGLVKDGGKTGSPAGSEIPRGEATILKRGLLSPEGGDFRIRYQIVRTNPRGTRLLTVPKDRPARIWDLATGREVATLSTGVGFVCDAAFSPDGKRIVTADSTDMTARIWDSETGELIRTLGISSLGLSAISPREFLNRDRRLGRFFDGPCFAYRNSLRTAAFSSDGSRVVTSGLFQLTADGGERRHSGKVISMSADVWNASTGEKITTLREEGVFILTARFGPEGRRILTALASGGARIWDAGTGKPLLSFEGHAGSLCDARFNPDGTRVVTAGCRDGLAIIWDSATGRKLFSLSGKEECVYDARFSPDGTMIVTSASIPGPNKLYERVAVRVWSMVDGTELFAITDGISEFNVARFSPDSRMLITASKDGSACVRDTETGEEILRFAGQAGEMLTAQYSGNGSRAITASLNGRVTVWPADPARIARRIKPRDLSIEEKRIYQIWNGREGEAIRIVDELFARLAVSENVIKRLDAMENLDSDVLAAALKFANLRKVEAADLYRRCYFAALHPDQTESAYRRALQIAEAICRREPRNKGYLCARAMAEYRLCMYEKTLDTLSPFAPSERTDNFSHSHALLFRAMALHQLGRTDEARVDMDCYGVLIERPDHWPQKHLLLLFEEADDLVKGGGD
jgi:WD40 repeat protein